MALKRSEISVWHNNRKANATNAVTLNIAHTNSQVSHLAPRFLTDMPPPRWNRGKINTRVSMNWMNGWPRDALQIQIHIQMQIQIQAPRVDRRLEMIFGNVIKIESYAFRWPTFTTVQHVLAWLLRFLFCLILGGSYWTLLANDKFCCTRVGKHFGLRKQKGERTNNVCPSLDFGLN